MRARFLGGEERPDGLRGSGERRIVGIDHRLGEKAGDPVTVPQPAELGHERVADDVAEAALRVGDGHVEREPWDLRVVAG
jgi:hypothetical protein